MPEVDDDSVVELDVEVDSEVVPSASDVEGEVVVDSGVFVSLQATSAKQSTNARTPASNLFVSMVFSFLSQSFVKMNKSYEIIIP